MAAEAPVSDVLCEAMEYLMKLGSNLRSHSENLKEKRICKKKLKNFHAVKKAADKVLRLCDLSKKSIGNVETSVHKILTHIAISQESHKDIVKKRSSKSEQTTNNTLTWQNFTHEGDDLRISENVDIKHYLSSKVVVENMPLSMLDNYPVHYDCKLYRKRNNKSQAEIDKSSLNSNSHTQDKSNFRENEDDLNDVCESNSSNNPPSKKHKPNNYTIHSGSDTNDVPKNQSLKKGRKKSNRIVYESSESNEEPTSPKGNFKIDTINSSSEPNIDETKLPTERDNTVDKNILETGSMSSSLDVKVQNDADQNDETEDALPRPLLKCVNINKLLRKSVENEESAVKNKLVHKHSRKQQDSCQEVVTVDISDSDSDENLLQKWKNAKALHKKKERDKMIKSKRKELKPFKPKEFSINVTRLPKFTEEFMDTHNINKITKFGSIIYKKHSSNSHYVLKQNEINVSENLNSSVEKNIDTSQGNFQKGKKSKINLLNKSSSTDFIRKSKPSSQTDSGGNSHSTEEGNTTLPLTTLNAKDLNTCDSHDSTEHASTEQALNVKQSLLMDTDDESLLVRRKRVKNKEDKIRNILLSDTDSDNSIDNTPSKPAGSKDKEKNNYSSKTLTEQTIQIGQCLLGQSDSIDNTECSDKEKLNSNTVQKTHNGQLNTDEYCENIDTNDKHKKNTISNDQDFCNQSKEARNSLLNDSDSDGKTKSVCSDDDNVSPGKTSTKQHEKLSAELKDNFKNKNNREIKNTSQSNSSEQQERKGMESPNTNAEQSNDWGSANEENTTSSFNKGDKVNIEGQHLSQASDNNEEQQFSQADNNDDQSSSQADVNEEQHLSEVDENELQHSSQADDNEEQHLSEVDENELQHSSQADDNEEQHSSQADKDTPVIESNSHTEKRKKKCSPKSKHHSQRKHIMESMHAKKMLLTYSSSSETDDEELGNVLKEIKNALLNGESDDEDTVKKFSKQTSDESSSNERTKSKSPMDHVEKDKCSKDSKTNKEDYNSINTDSQSNSSSRKVISFY